MSFVLAKEVFKDLKKKDLIKRGDYIEIAKATSKTRHHIKQVIESECTTTQDVVDYILEFYKKRIEHIKSQKI
jgi:hypothetical protein